ncbi:glucose dehydrogenase [FAD, quinone]-like [Lutzomyia longipalpis]|uniref:glucose dehydrogenase [FAD, quinone]-like n=1 Tax=Lutzomyia longipalpis TaxID=7200 RepID=UPI00248404BD|nr:glucose dehydrogenase [FAD, quinone]-like [Lutzomyia longipalpis]
MNNETFQYEIIEAAQELGIAFVEDTNGEKNVGFTLGQATIKAGVRDSTAMAFLVPAKKRPNLHVVKNAMVLNVIIDDDGEVRGVRMNLRGRRELKAYATKEVILSAGSINTPQLLMLSGIGPAEHLQKMGIPVIQDLQVGKNLQDHPGVLIAMKIDESTADSYTQDDLMDDFFAYLKDHSAKVTKEGDLLLPVLMFLTEESRGEILLRSSDPYDKPRIYPNYLATDFDVQSFVRAIRLLLKFLTTKAFKRHDAKLIILPIPECDALEFNSDVYWACYTKYLTTTIYHPVGTAKMGPDSDPDAVVDSRLRVKGVRGLGIQMLQQL